MRERRIYFDNNPRNNVGRILIQLDKRKSINTIFPYLTVFGDDFHSIYFTHHFEQCLNNVSAGSGAMRVQRFRSTNAAISLCNKTETILLDEQFFVHFSEFLLLMAVKDEEDFSKAYLFLMLKQASERYLASRPRSSATLAVIARSIGFEIPRLSNKDPMWRSVIDEIQQLFLHAYTFVCCHEIAHMMLKQGALSEAELLSEIKPTIDAIVRNQELKLGSSSTFLRMLPLNEFLCDSMAISLLLGDIKRRFKEIINGVENNIQLHRDIQGSIHHQQIRGAFNSIKLIGKFLQDRAFMSEYVMMGFKPRIYGPSCAYRERLAATRAVLQRTEFNELSYKIFVSEREIFDAEVSENRLEQAIDRLYDCLEPHAWCLRDASVPKLRHIFERMEVSKNFDALKNVFCAKECNDNDLLEAELFSEIILYRTAEW